MKTWRVAVHASFLVKSSSISIYGDMATMRRGRQMGIPWSRDWVIYPEIEAQTAREARKAAANLFRLDHPESNEPGDISGIIATENKGGGR